MAERSARLQRKTATADSLPANNPAADLRARQSVPAPAPKAALAPKAPPAKPAASPKSAFGPGSAAFSVAVVAALAIGWMHVTERHLTPQKGIGYWLGIAGGLMMLALLLYPLRKHSKRLRGAGKVATWFRAHMMLGIVGPALIVIHSGFKMESKNGAVAMIAMLLVVASGIVGRYLYARLHIGLYGRKAEASSLLADASALKDALGADTDAAADVVAELTALADGVLAATQSIGASLRYVTIERRSRRALRRRVLADVQAAISAQALREAIADADYRARLASSRTNVDQYFAAIERVAGLRLYERLFAAWHVLHMPLFFLLIATALGHVLAVHLY